MALLARSTIGFSLSRPKNFLLVDSPAPGLRNVQFTMRSSPAVMRPFSGESCSQMRFDDLFFWCSHHPLSRNQGSEHQILHCQDAALHPHPLVLPVAPFALCCAVVCFLATQRYLHDAKAILGTQRYLHDAKAVVGTQRYLDNATRCDNIRDYPSTLSKHFTKSL